MYRLLQKHSLKFVWLVPLLLLLYLFFYNSAQARHNFGDYDELDVRHVRSANSSTPATTTTTTAKLEVTVTLPVLTPRPTPSPKPHCQQQSSFVFIKTHKSGSTTLIAPFQKYAYLHNLTMMVPAQDNNIHLSWPFKFTPGVSHMAAPDGKTFQALVNHIVYNKQTVQPLMHPSAKYLTVLREPAPHLVSAYQYFSVNINNMFLRKRLADFELFLSDPVKYDPMPDWMKRLKNSEFTSLTRNLQSADLGLHYSNFDNLTAVKEFVDEIRRDFSILLVLERLAESLVLMKRKFCWSMQDILHVNKNIQKIAWNWNVRNVSQHLVPKIYEWNNADNLLYHMANDKLDELKVGEMNLEEEIKVYNDINNKVSAYCGGQVKRWLELPLPPAPLVIEATRFNDEFMIDRRVCGLLVIPEEDFTLLHKCRQYPYYNQCKQNSRKIHELTNLVNN